MRKKFKLMINEKERNIIWEALNVSKKSWSGVQRAWKTKEARKFSEKRKYEVDNIMSKLEKVM